MSVRPFALAAFVFTACTQEPAPVTPAPAPVASPTPPVASSAPPVTSAAPKEKPVCIPGSAGKGELVHLEAKDGKVIACFYDEKVGGEGSTNALAGQSHPCVLFDPTTGSLASAPPYKVPEYAEPAPPAIAVTTTADSVKACKGTTCKTVKVAVPKAAKPVAKKPGKGDKVGKAKGKGKGKGKKPEAPPVEAEPVPGLSVVVDNDMTKVFVFVRDHAKDGAMILHGDTYDLATGKRTARVPLSGVIDGVFLDPSNDHSGYWEGNRLVLRDQVCCGPGAAIVLLDPVKGGMKVLHGFSGMYSRHSTAKTWYSIAEKSLSWVDPDAMTMTPVVTGQGSALDPEAISASWTEVGGQLAFVWANPPGFAMVDAATHKAGEARSLALCTP